MQIREETTSDLLAIHRVHELAFDSSAEAQLVDLLRSRGVAAISLVAEDEGEIIGHILFSPVSIDPPDRGWRALGLAPVGVIPDRQRQGIGKALINEGLQRGKERGFHLVVVLGDPAYYTKFGFMRSKHFGLGNEYQADEHFMVVELTPRVLDSFTGLVKYASEFNEADC
jgi:putative acetyltransferase